MDYTIISITQRAEKNIDYNKKILDSQGYVFHDIIFFNGKSPESEPFKELKDRGFNVNSWSPFDNRKTPMMKSEAGAWISNINIYEYIVNNKIKNFLILEDDVILHEEFVSRLDLFTAELPKDYDFLSLFYFKSQNKFSEDVDLKLNYIQKSDNQKAGYQVTLVSYLGAKKILKLLSQKGLIYTNDCTIFFFAKNKMLNGFSKKRDSPRMAYHDTTIQSEIDPTNNRNLNLKDDIS